MAEADDNYVSYRQAAAVLGIHESTIAAHVKRGTLPTRGRSADDPHRPSLLRADVERLAQARADRADRGRAHRAKVNAARKRAQPPDGEPGWLTVPKAAEMIGVSEQLVRRWCAQAMIPATQVGQKWWIPEGDAKLEATARRGQPPDNVGDWITLRQAAGILDVSEQTMRRMCAREKVPATKVGGRWWVIRMHAENAALARERVSAGGL